MTVTPTWTLVEPDSDMARCVHCGAEPLSWCTVDEFRLEVAAHGVQLVDGWEQMPGPVPAWAPPFRWFFCQTCHMGGAVEWDHQ